MAPASSLFLQLAKDSWDRRALQTHFWNRHGAWTPVTIPATCSHASSQGALGCAAAPFLLGYECVWVSSGKKAEPTLYRLPVQLCPGPFGSNPAAQPGLLSSVS